jgi:hypothetical protein
MGNSVPGPPSSWLSRVGMLIKVAEASQARIESERESKH